MEFFGTFLLGCGFVFFATRRIPRYLHILQQDDYDSARFLKWIFDSMAFDRRVSFAIFLIGIIRLLLVNSSFENFWNYPIALILIVAALFEADPRKIAKKKFVMTPRAFRIFMGALGLCVGMMVCSLSYRSPFGWIAVVQLIPLTITLANWSLRPMEASFQKKFWNEANERLLQINPTVIGITGSFGKTSIKHILGHILEMNARTYYTPGSVNTPMGIARVIREKMPSDCRYFISEMGAYAVGSIARLCRLTPPSIGVISSIGEAHYERYKSLDAVAHAKFELAEAVLKSVNGKIVVHESVCDQDYAREFIRKNRERFVMCGPSKDVDLVIETINQTRAGIAVSIKWKDKSYDLIAPIFGKQHGDNLAVAFATAMVAGVTPQRVISALRTLPQITHRLEVKYQPNGRIYVDDAFNSNPKGFVSALELLSVLVESGGRRILVTPGVAELGERNDVVHHMLAEKAADLVDVALIVRSDRIPSFAPSFRQAGGRELHEMESLAAAQNWLEQNTRAGDVILYENDLPDVLEFKLRL